MKVSEKLAIALVLALLPVVVLSGCRKASPEKRAQTKGQQVNPSERDGSPTAVLNEPSAGSQELRITKIKFTPELLTGSVDLTLEPELENEAADAVQFNYRWFVNNNEIREAKDKVLKKNHFKKHDWIYCMIKARKGSRESNEYRSDFIGVGNSAPTLDLSPVPDFKVPGKLEYQINAIDIDHDPLTFKLVSPLDLGINLDSTTGLLTWNINEEIVKRIKGPVEIAFSVSDPDEAKASSSITLKFSPAIPTPD